MSTSQIFYSLIAVVFILMAVPRTGWAAALICGYILTLGGITATFFAMQGNPMHYGIAPGAPVISLGDVLLVGALLAIWVQGERVRIGWILVCFVLPAVVLLLTEWGNTPEQWAGLKLYISAIAAFGIGRWLSENLTEQTALVLATACLLVCGLHFVVAVAQSQGVTLIGVTAGGAEWIRQGRMLGIYYHPAMLGKTVFLLFCFLLPLSVSGSALTRRVAYLALTLGSVATLLTLSRANVVAIALTVVLWILLSGRMNTMVKRAGTVAVAVAFVVLNSSVLANLELRQAEDPLGGMRSYLFSVGLDQISAKPLIGTGPNYFIEVVGRSDPMVAMGYPIHNSFLFAVAELGIGLALVLLFPIFLTLIRTAQRVLRQKSIDTRAATLIAVLPGLVVIASTGWGVMTAEALPLWFLAFGFLTSQKMSTEPAVELSDPGAEPGRHRAVQPTASFSKTPL